MAAEKPIRTIIVAASLSELLLGSATTRPPPNSLRKIAHQMLDSLKGKKFGARGPRVIPVELTSTNPIVVSWVQIRAVKIKNVEKAFILPFDLGEEEV